MAVRNSIYRCGSCGNLLESLFDGGGPVTCCGQMPVLLEANSTDAAKEKHVPVIEKIPGGYKVTIGSVIHPMAEDHYIVFIQLLAGDTVLTQYLKPGDQPVAEFTTDAANVTVREYCNLHRLWEAKA
ncbi:MAG: desulfoferrodoxin [Candidatus Adiutrix sp.]|jgi:superoxide reductase|nr:desulfoferrodoxin [Candidatus Adiutrix sp.]